MATAEQIEYFLTNVIKVEDWKILNNNTTYLEKVQLLRKIVKNHVNTIYFQNVTMSATETEKRRAPTLEDIVNDGFIGKGGVCQQLNYFLRLVFDYLGYDTFTIAANVAQGSFPFSHCCTIVQIAEDELYFVDVASGLPNDEPIPLHQLPYRKSAAGYPFEYRRNEDGVYQRLQVMGSFTKGDYPDPSTEELRYSFTLEPKKLEDFDDAMANTFTNEKLSCFLRNTFVFRHFIDSEDPIEREKFILVWATTVVIGGTKSRKVKNYDKYKDLIPIFQKYFPSLVNSEVERALDAWSEFEIKFTKYIS